MRRRIRFGTLVLPFDVFLFGEDQVVLELEDRSAVFSLAFGRFELFVEPQCFSHGVRGPCSVFVVCFADRDSHSSGDEIWCGFPWFVSIMASFVGISDFFGGGSSGDIVSSRLCPIVLWHDFMSQEKERTAYLLTACGPFEVEFG